MKHKTLLHMTTELTLERAKRRRNICLAALAISEILTFCLVVLSAPFWSVCIGASVIFVLCIFFSLTGKKVFEIREALRDEERRLQQRIISR